MINQGLFTSLEEKYSTPIELFRGLNKEFNFTLDVCASPENAKCDRFFTLEDNGLLMEWTGETCWMNPPYGRQIIKWVRKAYRESLNGTMVVCLLPARTDPVWFHDYVLGKAEIRFIRGRLKFSGAKWNAPFPSMIVIYRPKMV